MRKRKKPTALLTVLVLCVGAVAIMGMPKSSGPNQAEQPPANDKKESPVGHDVNTPTKSQIVADVAQKVKDGKKAAPKPPEMEDGMPKPPKRTGPLALKEKPKAYTPTYNESATSTQWYTNQTPKDVPQSSASAPASSSGASATPPAGK